MGTNLEPKKITILVVAAITITLAGLVAFQWVGVQALLIPPVLIGIFVGYLILESRQFQLGLFVRQQAEIRSQYAQLEAMVGLVNVIKPRVPLSGTRSWAASPDLLRSLYHLVLDRRPELVVEASSGTSTLIIAYALERLGKGQVLSLEHDQMYAVKTQQQIDAHGLGDRARVLHAPLVEYDLEGAKVLWYDLSGIELLTTIDMLVVDGPPDSTMPMARYPAVPLLIKHFSSDTTVLLDDGAREDERMTASRWAEKYAAISNEYLELEKGAWSLRFRSKGSK